jgi:hypothetical protein
LHRDPLLAFRHILLNSPNLRKLHLAAYRASGCVVVIRPTPPFLSLLVSEAPKRNSPNISFKLEELSLTRFLLQEDISFILQSRWTNLHSLNLNDCCDIPNLFRHLTTKISICFPALRSLGMTYEKDSSDPHIYADLTAAVGTVMEAFVPGFEELNFAGPFAGLVDIIAGNQSRSLIRLTVHEVEFPEGEDVRRTAPITAVEKLVERCDSLKELHLDANTVKRDQSRSDLSMEEIYECFQREPSAVPHLESLSIALPVGIVRRSPPSEEEKETAHAMCRALLGQREALKKVQLKVGEHARWFPQWPPQWGDWEHQHAYVRTFQKDADGVTVESICSTVRHVMNPQLTPPPSPK